MNIGKFKTTSPEETMALSCAMARHLPQGAFIALIGDLGTGKTVFVKGLAKGLGIEEYMYVNSPSFVILKEYSGTRELYHFDVYRLEEQGFCDTMDYRKYFYSEGVTVVEWADRIKDILPDKYLEVRIEYGGFGERILELRGLGPEYEKVVDDMGDGCC